MELKMQKMQNKKSKQRGSSLIEMLIACLVLIVGVAGVVTLIPIAIGANSRNRQQSNSTVIAQMVMEKILSVPAGTAIVLTINDCVPNTYNINTAGSTGAGSGATLLASGDVNFNVAAPAGYSMLYTACGPTGGQSVYDVRWNIQQPTTPTFVKMITVSAKLRGSGNDLKYFSLPVSIRSTAGSGS
jgi:Tfp pilus assembly protein PilV